MMNVVISGASKGIGKAIAESFAAEGANLFLCARNEFTLYNAVASIQLKFPASTVNARVADLSKPAEVKKFGDWVLSKVDTIDVLVNNAGSFIPGSIFNEEPGMLEQMIDTNLYSAYHLTRSLLPLMMQHKKGHIFNMCSIASLQAYPNGGSYSISKYALMGFSKNLREELKPFNVKVTAVYPGAVLTDSWKDFDNTQKRIMEADDIALTVLAATKLSLQAVIEDIIIRPQLGDL